MSVQVERRGVTLVVHVQGELDMVLAVPFKDTVTAAFTSDARLRHLTVDLRGVTFVDSTGLAALIGRYRDVVDRGGEMTVNGASSNVRKLFELSGLDKLFLMDRISGDTSGPMEGVPSDA